VECLVCRQIVPVGQRFKRCEIGIARTEGLDLRAMEMSLGVFRPDRDCPSVVLQCLVEPAPLPEEVAQAVVRLGMVRIGGKALPAMRYRVIAPALCRERDAKIAVRIGIGRFEDKRAFVMLYRTVELALLTEDHPQIVVSLGIIRSDLDRPCVVPDSFIGLTSRLER